MKFFNTAGPVKDGDHYMLDPLSRIDLDDFMMLIRQEKYFVLHAPRQTGKTSMLLALMKKINQEGAFRCLYVNVEPAQMSREDVGSAIKSIAGLIAHRATEYLDDPFLETHHLALQKSLEPQILLTKLLADFSAHDPRPLVLLIDEIDALIGDSLVSVLRQLRAGYASRPERFPQSIVLCGVRDVRDYRIHASSEKDPITGGSAFNVKAKSLRMGNFVEDEVHQLLHLHTLETGQEFTPQAIQAIWHHTQGQPWLVNALAYEVTFEMKENRDPAVVITKDMVMQARENLILRRETHLDQLVDKLKEPRVHRVIAPILAGVDVSESLQDDDISYVYDLGLIERKPLRIANPIYQEVIPRVLTGPTQESMTQELHWYQDETTGQLDMTRLLKAFQQFYRENIESWREHYQYKEAGAQLLLQAFLQRVVNGGARIDREYGLGTGRTDLLVRFAEQRIVLELKLRKGSREATIEKALPQITGYMDRCGSRDGHLVIFDQTDASWEEKIFREETVHEGTFIQIWGM